MEYLGKLFYTFSPELRLEIEFVDNGDRGVGLDFGFFANNILVLEQGDYKTTFNVSCISSDTLLELADILAEEKKRPFTTERVSYSFNQDSNGGEMFSIMFLYEGGECVGQQITLQSYGNSASIDMKGNVINEANLRELVQEISNFEAEILGKIRNGKSV